MQRGEGKVSLSETFVEGKALNFGAFNNHPGIIRISRYSRKGPVCMASLSDRDRRFKQFQKRLWMILWEPCEQKNHEIEYLAVAVVQL